MCAGVWSDNVFTLSLSLVPCLQTGVLALREQYAKEEERPFNSERKWMAVRVHAVQGQVSWDGVCCGGTVCDIEGQTGGNPSARLP